MKSTHPSSSVGMKDRPPVQKIYPIADNSEIHEWGAERHGIQWMLANRRAVEELWNTNLRADSPEVKQALPRVILRLLDGAKVDGGFSWDKDTKKWIKKPEAVNE